MQNNQVKLTGMVDSPFVFSHSVYGENFYSTMVSTERTSGTIDTLPVIVSERIMDVTQDYTGQYIEITGEFRSRNKEDGARRKLDLYIFATEAQITDDPTPVNEIRLQGFLCRKPTYRETPLGRKIADILLAVNRLHGKSDYIPCICWGRNAIYADGFDIGSEVCITGRIQSREYVKRISDTESETRIAYEVSAVRIEGI